MGVTGRDGGRRRRRRPGRAVGRLPPGGPGPRRDRGRGLRRARRPGRDARALGGYRFDTGPTVLTMPHLVERCFDAAGRRHGRPARLRPVDPMYRACYADGSRAAGAPRARGDGRRGPHGCAAPARRRRSSASATGSTGSTGSRCRTSSSGTTTRRSTWPGPLAPAVELVRLGAFGRLARAVGRRFADERLRRLFTFQSLYAGLAPYEALAALRRHHLHGRGQRRGRARGRHARPARGAGRGGREGGRPVPLRHPRRADPAGAGDDGPVTGVRLAGGEVVPPGRSCATPTSPGAYRTLLPGLAAAPGRPHGPLLALGRRVARRRAGRCPPGRRTTTSTSAASGTGRSGRCSATACGCPTRRCWSRCRR